MVEFSFKQALVFVFFLLLITACTQKEEMRYYGNFEAEELLLPSGGAGKVVKLFVSEGQPCDSGETVVVVDTVMLSLERERIMAAIEAMKASVPDISAQLDVILEKQFAYQRELSKIESLIVAGSASETMADPVKDKIALVQKEYNAAKSGLGIKERVILSQISAMKSELKMIQERIKRCYLKMPFDSKILTVNVKQDEYVAEGTPVMLLSRRESILFMAWVPGNHLFSLSPGDSVTLLSDRPRGEMAEYRGVVVHVSEKPQFVPSMVQTRESRAQQHYKVKVKLYNDGTIKPGMPGELVP